MPDCGDDEESADEEKHRLPVSSILILPRPDFFPPGASAWIREHFCLLKKESTPLCGGAEPSASGMSFFSFPILYHSTSCFASPGFCIRRSGNDFLELIN